MLPEVSVVVASRDRPLRLRWLLNALEEQTLNAARFEVIVAHDSKGAETEEVLRTHPLAAAGVLRHLAFPHGEKTPGGNRNAAWRVAQAPLIAITDDDCRPVPEWLEVLVEAWSGDQSAVLQGVTAPDPYEAHVLSRVPYARTVRVEPPDWRAATANIAYPRALLERVGGFDETALTPGGEDTDLFLRARQVGGRIVPTREALVYHCVHPMSFAEHLRFTQRWMHLPYVVARHPYLRRHVFAGLFWKERHAWMCLALAGVAGTRRSHLTLLALLPWIEAARPRLGRSPRGIARTLLALPARALVDLAEMLAMVRGSVRYRTPFL